MGRAKITLGAKRGLAAKHGAEMGGQPVAVRCAYCPTEGTITWFGDGTVRCSLEYDHVIPVGRGGPNVLSNLVIACAPCNASKCNRTIEEWRAWLSGPHGRRSKLMRSRKHWHFVACG